MASNNLIDDFYKNHERHLNNKENTFPVLKQKINTSKLNDQNINDCYVIEKMNYKGSSMRCTIYHLLKFKIYDLNVYPTNYLDRYSGHFKQHNLEYNPNKLFSYWGYQINKIYAVEKGFTNISAMNNCNIKVSNINHLNNVYKMIYDLKELKKNDETVIFFLPGLTLKIIKDLIFLMTFCFDEINLVKSNDWLNDTFVAVFKNPHPRNIKIITTDLLKKLDFHNINNSIIPMEFIIINKKYLLFEEQYNYFKDKVISYLRYHFSLIDTSLTTLVNNNLAEKKLKFLNLVK